MHHKEDQLIRSIFPKMKGRTIIYLGDSYALPDGLLESLSLRFSAIGYRFIVLSNLLRDISPQIVGYLFPGLDYSDPTSVVFQVKNQAGLCRKNGLLYKKSRYWYFRFREVCSPLSLSEDADALIDQLWAKPRVCFSKRTAEKKEKSTGHFIPSIRPKAIKPTRNLSFYDEIEQEESESDIRLSIRGPEEGSIPFTHEILSEINRILNEYHLTIDELEILIGYTVKLSKMKITRNGRIIMTDFEEKEIKMDNLTKMVYFFYLRHPEGVRFKEVDDYREELLHIYMGITGRDNPEEIRNSVIGHIDPYGSGLRISASRIRKAFRDQFGEKVAKFYCLEGKKGEPYSIAIDRDYVIWEYPE